MELGIYTFGDLVADPHTGRTVSGQERMWQMLELAKLADQAGLDVIGVGEHHGIAFVNSATATTIAAMGAITHRIRLTSASTLLGTADPVRTYQEFATADLISGGRVELIFGRGAFTESFPLFGYALEDYDALFEEKLELFDLLNTQPRVTWSGQFRPALHGAEIAPRAVQDTLPTWIGAGSGPSITRAARRGYPLALPVLGGSIPQYREGARLYHSQRSEAGLSPGGGKIAVYAHLHVTESSRQAREDFFPYYAAYLEPIFKHRMQPSTFEQMLSPTGTFVGGSPNEVIDKILALHEATGNQRFVGQIDIAGQPFTHIARGLELFATQVAPAVRKAVSA
ncbi:LLM class flavin-dependent oxidoreductase [Pectobacterium aroidearum]|uniref:LLM class flavin-dependent oxidoreductase n=1 Tax=Pectobacterium aroidearum TaxID=1201031 RepID=UPI0032F01AED